MPTPTVNEAGIQFARQHLSFFPRPDRAASEAIRKWASDQGVKLDPDKTDVVTFHYQLAEDLSWRGIITGKTTLTEAVMSNWQGESNNNLVGNLIGEPWAGHLPGTIQVVDSLRPLSWNQPGTNHSVFNGVFRRTEPQVYGPQTLLNLPAQDLQAFIWSLDFHTTYKTQLDHYWTHAKTSHTTLAKMAFIATCNKQVSEGSLDDNGRQLAWQAAGLMPRSPTFRMRALNIYGYSATDLIYLYDKQSPRAVLYIPGNSSALHTFANERAMKLWIAKLCQTKDTREALGSHFALADMPDGLDFSGLHTALAGLGVYPAVYHLPPDHPGFTNDGTWAPRDYVNYRPDTYNPAINGDLFQALTERQRLRSYQDADTLITTNAQVIKSRWRGYLNCALNLLGPLAIVLPELAPLFALGGIAQFGLGLDAAINGHNQDDKAQGVSEITFGLLNALPLVHAGVSKAPALFRFKYDGFVMPREVNGRWGYPLSPVDPPHLPAEAALEYFHLPAPVQPLAGADQAVSAAVERTPSFSNLPDTLKGYIADQPTELVYDIEADAFIKKSDLNAVDAPRYIASTESKNLAPVPEGRLVEDQMRMSSLRALGVDITLPIKLPSRPPFEPLIPIPKIISCIWVGDKLISNSLLTNLANNMKRLSGSGYWIQLFLSNASREIYIQNLGRLSAKVPGLLAFPLEEHPFYIRFKETANYPQYQAALGGAAPNFASAADVLRYPLLDHEGGIYMDIDDKILTEGEYPYSVEGIGFGTPASSLEKLNLSTTPDGLLLYPPIANEKMNINCAYNNSIIASHPNNPTLKAISAEMHTRFQADPTFYDSKPDERIDPEGFAKYANNLSRMTGPTLLTDVTDKALPDLHTLRHLINLNKLPTINSYGLYDRFAMETAQQQFLPFNQLIKIGQNNAWA
ncbi:dermonecrotic toxin domain-containing protein [Pseudomonas sp. NUPR-001]|uniref:dermonecrotic toxin domain-containing protein n=1 Tax=Pseudomonas sp. NUPR-001 TaxID=3416058 RepID=UPI003F952698